MTFFTFSPITTQSPGEREEKGPPSKGDGFIFPSPAMGADGFNRPPAYRRQAVNGGATNLIDDQ
jgi:hypothetical protein